MAEGRIKNSELFAIAAAIRQKNGLSTTYKPGEMAQAILDIPAGGTPVIESKSITANGTYTAPTGVDGYSPVTVAVQPNLQSKTITENGTVTPDSGYDGLSSVLVNVSGGGGDIFGGDFVHVEYIGNLKTHSFVNTGYYAVLGAIDGRSTSTISYSVSGASVLDSDNQTSASGSYGSTCTGVLLHAQAGDTIEITGTKISRQVMIVICLTDRINSLSSITLAVKKDSSITQALDAVAKEYCFYIAGTTGDNNTSVTISSDNTIKWMEGSTSPVTLHKYGAYSGTRPVSCTVAGTSYSTNYIMLFEAE